MDILGQLISTYSSKEGKAFCDVLNSVRCGSLEQKLFELIRKNPKAEHETHAMALYGEPNMTAYFSVRKRLHKKCIDFAPLVEVDSDETMSAQIRSWMTLAERLLRHNKKSASANFLKKARHTAEEYRHYGLLDQILFIELKNAEKLKIPAEEAILRWELNYKKLLSKRRLDVVYTRLRADLQRTKMDGITLEPDAIIDSLFKQFKLTQEEAADPEFMLQLAATGRCAFLSVKDFSKIAPFIIRAYRRLKKINAFTRANVACELEFLFMISHAQYRNLNFKDGATTLNEMEAMMTDEISEALSHKPKFISLKAEFAAYSGELDAAINLLKHALKENFSSEDESEHLNMILNLAVCYFNAGKWRDANATIITLPRDSDMLENKGEEWILKKNMIHMIIQYELNNDGIAHDMLKRMQKTHAGMLKKPLYQLTHHFLKFVGKMIANPDVINTDKFQAEVNAARKSWPKDKEDIHAITFFCWLKCKILKRDYYPVLLERVNRK